jgi:type II secretory pathway predicted ATPase ExeA
MSNDTKPTGENEAPAISEPSRTDLRRLRSHYQFSHAPFSKYGWNRHMYDSGSQRELLYGLLMWLEVRGIALVTGPSGVGKSITIRRFLGGLEESRFRIVVFGGYVPGTVHGFLRSLNRKLDLPQRAHTTDLFDQVHKHLASLEAETGAHPLLVIDDAEGLRPSVVDVIRRLTVHEVDGEDPFSVLLAGTDALLPLLRDPSLQPLVTRIVFAEQLRAFGIEDARNYIRHHLERASVSPKLFSEDAVKRIFQASQGKPRSINQLALQAMISAAVTGRDQIDGAFLQQVLQSHPLYAAAGGPR